MNTTDIQNTSIIQPALTGEDHQPESESARGVKDYNDSIWNGMRQIVVYEGLIAKFSQNADLRRELLATGSSLLAECAVKDTIWGIGLSMTDPGRLNPWKWKWQNLLGYTLMKAREKFSSL